MCQLTLEAIAPACVSTIRGFDARNGTFFLFPFEKSKSLQTFTFLTYVKINIKCTLKRIEPKILGVE